MTALCSPGFLETRNKSEGQSFVRLSIQTYLMFNVTLPKPRRPLNLNEDPANYYSLDCRTFKHLFKMCIKLRENAAPVLFHKS